MTSVLNSVSNSTLNLKHNLQWFLGHNVSKPLASLNISIRGREAELDKTHKSQKELFKKLFEQAFKEEQKELLTLRQSQTEIKLAAEGLTPKQIQKEVKKLKAENFHDKKSNVSVVRYLKFITREVGSEMMLYNKDQKTEGFFFKYRLVRHGHPIRILSEPFFQTTDETQMISWEAFKTDVFYKYIADREAFLQQAKRQKTILKLLDRAWTQLQAENDSGEVTYDDMKERLQSFDHGLDADFFAQPFWLEKGDNVIANDDDYQEFKQKDCQITLDSAEAYRLLKDLQDEVFFEDITEDDVKLGKSALESDYKIEESRKSRNSRSSRNSRNSRNSRSSKSSKNSKNSNNSDNSNNSETSEVSQVSQKSINSKVSNADGDADTSDAEADSKDSTDPSQPSVANVAGSGSGEVSDVNQVKEVKDDQEDAPKTGLFNRMVSTLKRIGSRKSLSRRPSVSQSQISSADEKDVAEVTEVSQVTPVAGDSGNPSNQGNLAPQTTVDVNTSANDQKDDSDSKADPVSTNEDATVDVTADETSDDVTSDATLKILELNEDISIYSNLQEADLKHATSKLMFQEIQQQLQEMVEPSVGFAQKLLLKTKSRISQILEIVDKEIVVLKKTAKKATSGFTKLVNKIKVIEERKKEFDAKIEKLEADAHLLKDDFKSIIRFLEHLFRSALGRSRPKITIEEMIEKYGSWKDVQNAQEVATTQDSTDGTLTAEKSKTSRKSISKTVKSNLDHLLAKLDTVVLTNTLEDASNFEGKQAQLKIDFKVSEGSDGHTSNVAGAGVSSSSAASSQTLNSTPNNVDYSNQIPEDVDGDRDYPSCVEAVCVLKEWQNLRNGSAHVKLSRDFICDRLGARHTKSKTAVNISVQVSVYDVLEQCKTVGFPDCKSYENYCKMIKTKTGNWLHEFKARFELIAAKCRFDSIRLLHRIEDIEHSIAQYGCLLLCLPVYNSCKTQFWRSDEKHSVILGYDTVLVTGYHRSLKYLTFKNMQGKSYGDNGFAYIKYSEVLECKFPVILCQDMTSGHCSWVKDVDPQPQQVQQIQETKESQGIQGQEFQEPPAASCAKPLICQEDAEIRIAKSYAVGRLGGRFKSYDFDIVAVQFGSTFKDPRPNKKEYKLVDSDTLGVALVGFASQKEKVKCWSTDVTEIAGTFVFLNQRVAYRDCDGKEIVMHLKSVGAKWVIYHGQQQSLHIPIKCEVDGLELFGHLLVDLEKKKSFILHL